MAMQVSTLNDDKYLHWIRTSLSLLYLKEGLAIVCDEKSTEFHKDIRWKVQLKSLFAATSTCNTCTYRDVKKTKKHGILTWHIQCGSNICNVWLDEILLSHKDYPCPDIAWANSDPQLWPTDVWEVSKLFQPYGCASQKSAAESDCQGLLRLLKTCTYFHQFLSNKAVLEWINDVRNACMHSSSLQIEEAEMRRGLDLMISLLEQPHLKNRTSCVEARITIEELRDNRLDISLNKELELRALNNKIAAVRSDVDRLEAELQQLQTSLSDVTTCQDNITTRQDTTVEEYRQMCERIRELGQYIAEMKTSQEQINQAIDPSLGSKMADLTSRLQELETNSNKEIERLEGSFQSTIARIETKLGSLETQRVAQQTAQPVDIKRLQRQLIRLYDAKRLHIPVYLLRSERKIRLEDIYVEQRLKVVDPDGRMKTDSSISHSRRQTRSDLIRWGLQGRSEAGTSEKIISSLRDVFYSEDNKCQYVYVSGNAGYGKSIFCSHLVRLWCNAHSGTITALTQDEDMMTEFPLLFCVDLRDAKYEGTDEVCSLIQKQLQLSNFDLTNNALSKLLQDIEQVGQVLVVMDALDECKEERLPRGCLYNCTTLVTSRPWKLEAVRCDPECRVEKELEIVGLKKGSPKDLSENLVKMLNKKWNKKKRSEDFIQKMESEDLQEFLEVPVLLTAMLCLWFDDVPFGQSQVEIYRTSIHHQILAAVKAKDIPDYSCSSEVPFPICQREKCPCKCYGELLWKVSELACKALFGNVQERLLVMDHDQTEFLGLTDKEVAICMKLGILTQYKLLGNVTDYEPQKSVSFTHKTYQEWFAAVYLSSKLPVSELDKLLSGAIIDLDSALELDQIFLFVCGMNEEVAAKLNKFMLSKVSTDTRVQEYRRSCDSIHYQLISTIQNVIIAGVVEAIKNKKESIALQLHDVYIVEYNEQILVCDTSHARSVYIEYINIQESDESDVEDIHIQESDVEARKITPWPASSCLEKLVLVHINDALDDTFCANFSAACLVVLHVENIALLHDQLESLCMSCATADNLKPADITDVTCLTHQGNGQECNIQMDFSQYVRFLKRLKTWCRLVGIKITSWPLSCMETVELFFVDISSCDTFCDNFNVDNVSDIYMENVTLTHDQLESLCASLASAGSLRKVRIFNITCITHTDNRQDCNIMLDLSQHHGLEEITLWHISVGEVRGVSLCQNIVKLEKVGLVNITLPHNQMESLCQSLASAENLKTLHMDVTCLTHKDNRQECNIQLDFSQYVNFQKIQKGFWLYHPVIKITSWPFSCMETVDLRHVDFSSCDTFCDNFNIDIVSNMYMGNVTLAHDQLESLCQKLASAGSLRTVNNINLTCITHKDNRQDCSIILDLSQHQGLEKLKLSGHGFGEEWVISLGQNMMKLETVELYSITLTHVQLESLCQSLATAVSLRTVDIRELTCIKHKDNRQGCIIMLDLSKHQRLECFSLVMSQITNLCVGEVRGVNLCQNMDKLQYVMLAGFCISAAALRHTLKTLPGHRVEVKLSGYCFPALRVRGAEEARKLLEEVRQATYTYVAEDDVEYMGDECVVKRFWFYNKW